MHKRILLTNFSKKDVLYISSTDIDADFKASYHSHPNLEILLITKGSGKIFTTHKQIPIKEGSVVIINSNSNHYEFSNTSCSFYAIGIDNSNAYLKETFRKKIIYFDLDKDEFSKMNKLYNLIFDEGQSNIEDPIIDNCLDAILTVIRRNSEIIFKHKINDNFSPIVATAKDIIDNYYFSNLTLEDIASRLSISVSRLAHMFKKEVGMTLIDYKLLSQITESYNLLELTDMPIISIASAVGFNNSAYFTKVFKRWAAMTPKRYREIKKKQAQSKKEKK